MWKRDDAALLAAYAAHPEPRYELSVNDEDDAADGPAYDPPPPGSELTREGFEAFVHADAAYQEVLNNLMEDAEERSKLQGDFTSTLPFRGPFVSLQAANVEASSFVPMLVDESPDGCWHVEIRFRSASMLRKCVHAAAVAAGADAAADAPGADEPVDANNALFYPALGRDLLGFNGMRDVPERLAGRAPAAWTLSPWLRLFAGRTLRYTVAAPTWRHGCAAVHDFLLTYTRDAHGLWAAIDTNGLRVLAPADMPSPMQDLQGKRNDYTSRDMEMTRTLEQQTPHAYIFIVNKEFPPGLLQLSFTREKVVAALESEAAARALPNKAALEEAAPASLLAVRVVDKHAPHTANGRLLPNTTAREATAKHRSDVRAGLQRIFTDTFADDTGVEHFSMIKCHAVTPTRACAFGMQELVDDLASSFKRAQHAEYRRTAHAMLRNAQTALSLFAAVATAVKNDADADTGAGAATAAVLAAEKARLVALCQKKGDPAQHDHPAQLEEVVESVLLERISRPLYEQLLDGLNAASEAPFKLLAELDALGIGPNAQGPVSARCTNQLEHLQCSHDSKVLAALLRPALDALARFGSTTLSLMAHGPRIVDEVTTAVLESLLGGDNPLAPLLARRDMNPADAHDRLRLKQWLFVQQVRLVVLREVGAMQAALAAISGADLREAAVCCGCTFEHFQAVSEAVRAKCTKAKTQAAFVARNNMLAEDNGIGHTMLRNVCASLADHIGTYFYDLMYAAAERVKKGCLLACTQVVPAGVVPMLGGYESDADEDGIQKILRAAQIWADGGVAVGGSTDPGPAQAAARDDVIRDIHTVVDDLVKTLQLHGVSYDTTLVAADVAAAPAAVAEPSNADAILRRVIMRTRQGAKRAREQWKTRHDELLRMTVLELHAIASELKLGLERLRRKADLARRISEHEHPLDMEGEQPAKRRALYQR